MSSPKLTNKDFNLSNTENLDIDEISFLNFKVFNLELIPTADKLDGINSYNNTNNEKIKINQVVRKESQIPLIDEKLNENNKIEQINNKIVLNCNINDKQINFYKLGLATTQGFFKHPNLIHNNFVINSPKNKIKVDTALQNNIKSQIEMNNINPLFNKNNNINQSSNTINSGGYLLTDENIKYLKTETNKPVSLKIKNTLSNENNFVANKTISKQRLNNKKNILINLFNSITNINTSNLKKEDLKYFLTNTIPEGKILNCNLIRKKKGEDTNLPKYFLFINNKFVMGAFTLEKKKSFELSMCDKILYEDNYENYNNENYLGKVISNFFGTEFNIIYERTITETSTETLNLGTIKYEVSLFGLKKPRKLKVLLPKINKENYLVVEDKFQTITTLINKKPEWSEKKKAYVLNFNGRVEIGSKKNFQIVEEDLDKIENNNNKIILQFGKKKKNQYSMDLIFPLTPTQALGICLSTLANKLASD